MVEITTLAKLLEIPGIEPETAQLINAKLRELIGKVEPPERLTADEQKQEVQSILAEYIDGVVNANGNSNGNAAR